MDAQIGGCNIDAHTRPKKDPDAIRARYRSEKQRKLIKKQYSMLTQIQIINSTR
jgi:hypothetical protein